MKRTRTKGRLDFVTVGHNQKYRRCSDDAITSEHNYTYSPSRCKEGKISIITDELLPRADLRTRFCDHQKLQYWAGPHHYVYGDRGASTYGYAQYQDLVYMQTYTPYSSFVIDTARGVQTLTLFDLAGDMDAFNARAWTAMKPTLEQEVSLTNFLLELKDFKEIYRFFTRSADFFKKVSEGHLSYEFGIKPIIGDVRDLWNHLHDYEKMIRDFVNRAEKPQRRYYSERTDLAEPNPDWIDHYGAYWRRCVVKNSTMVKTATMTYDYNIQELKSLSARLKGLRDILGLRLTPSVVWNAIPFSFIVDWVLNVGQFLKSRESALIEPDVTITDYSVSVKVEFTEILEVKLPSVCPAATVEDPFVMVSGKGKLYRRVRCLPETEGIPLSLALPSANQLALAASLINVARG